jgi:hypothetical protein
MPELSGIAACFTALEPRLFGFGWPRPHISG